MLPKVSSGSKVISELVEHLYILLKSDQQHIQVKVQQISDSQSCGVVGLISVTKFCGF